MSFLLGRIEEFAGYEDQGGLRFARGGEETLGRATATDVRAILREIQVAKKDVVEALGEEGKSLLDGFRAIHVQVSGGKAFGKKAAKAFFIVENKNGAATKRIEVGWRESALSAEGRAGRSRRSRLERRGKIHGKCGATRGQSGGLDGAAVLADNGQADAEAEAGAAAGTLGGVKRIEQAGDGIRRKPHAVILESSGKTRALARKTNLDSSRIADFANGLFSVGDEIQKNLDELIGVPDDLRKIRLGTKFDFDIISAQGMLVEL